MDRTVIIDGVVVSGCDLYSNGKCRNFSHLVQGEYIECNTMCDYGAYARKEQLQQLKKENKELKEFLSKEPLALQALQKAYSSYKKDTETLWGMLKEIKDRCEKYIADEADLTPEQIINIIEGKEDE